MLPEKQSDNPYVSAHPKSRDFTSQSTPPSYQFAAVHSSGAPYAAPDSSNNTPSLVSVHARAPGPYFPAESSPARTASASPPYDCPFKRRRAVATSVRLLRCSRTKSNRLTPVSTTAASGLIEATNQSAKVSPCSASSIRECCGNHCLCARTRRRCRRQYCPQSHARAAFAGF